MLVFEMAGGPGIGKSTLSRQVINNLGESGYRVGTLEDIYFRHRKDRGKLSLLIRILADAKHYPLYLDALLLKLRYGNQNGSWNYAGRLVFFLYEWVHIRKNEEYDILLLEEGLVQYISSLLYMEKLPAAFRKEKIYADLAECGHEPFVFVCNLQDIYENILRLKNRKADTRFFRIRDDNELKQAMEAKKHNLDIIAGGFKYSMQLDMAIPVEENVKLVTSVIAGLVKSSR